MVIANRKQRIGKKTIDKTLSDKEKKQIDLAKIAWGQTLRDFYYPPLKEPNFVFDYTQVEGFYIDPEHKWQITMNLANVPLFEKDEEYIKYFYAISLHEASHYQIIPYDGLTNARLLRAALKHVNYIHAPIVVNIFADLIVDTKLHNKNSDLMEWELKHTFEHVTNKNIGEMSDFSKFLLSAYEKMWNLKISDESLPDSIDSLAEKVVKVIAKDLEDESMWEQKITRIAWLMKKLINDTFTLIGVGGICDKGKTKRNGPGGGGQVEIPEDVLEIMDNPLDNKNKDKLKEGNEDELRQKAEEFAKDTPYSSFGAPAGQAGILIDGNPLATWYRGIAKNLIDIQVFQENPGGNLPVCVETWRLGDPLDELDVVQSLLNCPVLIPNITTRKWTFEEGPGNLIEKEIPDLLIVLDSSGSMEWHYSNISKKGRGPYHTAVVASFASLHCAAKKGAKFSVINFSNFADVCPWTSDQRQAEKVLLRYQGGGTVMPTKQLVEQCLKAEKPVLVFIITDFGIHNWDSTRKTLISLANQGHKIVGFFIGPYSRSEDCFNALENKVVFYPIKSPEDLINLVVKEIKDNYG